MNMHRLLLLITAVTALPFAAHAQIDVRLDLTRRVYLRGEPIEVTVTIRNLAGHDITLRDTPGNPWFGFEIFREGAPVPPRDAAYRNPPVTILNGDTVSRSVNLLRLYPVNELSSYKLRATVHFHETGKDYSSNQKGLDISEGRKVFKQTVGVPNPAGGGGGELRSMQLLIFQQPKELALYARVEDEATGTILGTFPLGRIISGAEPAVEFSNDNTMYAFHMTGPSVYALSKIGVNGEWLGQTLWHSPRGRAAVRRKPDGTMVVVGATREKSRDAGAPPVPKLSDAPPVPIPGF